MGIDYIISSAFANMHGSEFINKIMLFISEIGNNGYLFLILAIFLFPFKKLRKISIGLVVCALLILVLNNLLLKKVIARDRPFITYPELLPSVIGEAPTSLSFPSGHSAVNFAFAAFFCCYKKKYLKIAIPTSIFAFLVGFSRIYLIHHYFTDVIAGMILGIGCGIAAFFLTPLIEKMFIKFKMIEPNEQ